MYMYDCFAEDALYSLVLSGLTRFFLTLATSIKWVYTLELMPTNIRSLGFAMAFAMGRIGGIFAPYIRDMVRIDSKYCKDQ